MTQISMRLPHGWQRLEAPGFHFLAVHTHTDAVPANVVVLGYPHAPVPLDAECLYVVEQAPACIGGRPARRTDLTRRDRGLALFTRRWLVEDSGGTLEIAASCPLERFADYAPVFDAIVESAALTRPARAARFAARALVSAA